jgi:GGDEF domain-containing protein
MTGQKSAENIIVSGLTEEDTRLFRETFLPGLPDKQQQLIRGIFQEETKILQYPGKERATSLLENIFSLAFDPGLRRSDVYVLTRQAFITRLKNKVGFKQTDNGFTTDLAFAVFKFDLAGIGSMSEEEGDRAISALASGLNSFFSQPIQLTNKEEKKLIIDPSNIIFGRYGGDEFVVGLVNQSKEAKNLFAQALKEAIDEIRYKKDDQREEKVELKGGQIDSFDSSSADNQIFFRRLALGQVLTEEEIEKEKQNPVDFSPKTIEMPEKLDDLKSKILELIQVHPEFKVLFYIAEHFDRKAQDINFLRTRRLYEFIANNVFDPLLGRIAIGRGDLLFHLGRGEFKKAFAFELKIKETNDQISYGYSDQMIIEFWKKMKRVFGEEKINSFKIGRFGGLIVVFSAEENFGLTADQISQLSSIELNNGLTHFVGLAEIDLSEQEETVEKARKIYESASSDWLEKVLSYYNQNQEAKQRFLGFLENPRTKPEDHKDMDYIHASYFNKKGRLGKRKKQVEEVARKNPELAVIFQELLEILDQEAQTS